MSRNCLVMFGTVILTRTELVSLSLPDLPRTNAILFLPIWVHWKWIWSKRMLSPQWYLSDAKPLYKWSVRGKCLTPHSLPAVLREVSAVDLRILVFLFWKILIMMILEKCSQMVNLLFKWSLILFVHVVLQISFFWWFWESGGNGPYDVFAFPFHDFLF